jgi:hypothetical protein
VIAVGRWGPWQADLGDGERAARCRELRALALVYVGAGHPLTTVLCRATAEPSALADARIELGAIPAVWRRRLLAAVRPAGSRA